MTVLSLDVITDDLDPVEGNVTRDLWKISAWELANDVSGVFIYTVCVLTMPSLPPAKLQPPRESYLRCTQW